MNDGGSGDRSLSAYLGIGATAAATIVVCGALGFVVDNVLDTLPAFVFVGLAAGVAGAVAFVWSRFRDSLRGPGGR